MNANVSFDENIDDSGLIISVTQRNSSQVLVVSYNWPALFLVFFSIFGIVGNLLVCLAIGTERRLHNRTNWFLFSLSVADMIVSGVVIPLAIVKEFTGFWMLGPVLCDFWIFLDVCSCTSSIMHIVVISIDRYFAIKDPLNVRSRQEKRQICLLIILIWLIAIFLSSPMIVLGAINPYNIIINGQCLINNQFFVIYGSVVSFVIPLIIVILTYGLTVHRLKIQIKQFENQYAQEQTANTSNNTTTRPLLRRQIGANNNLNHFSQSASFVGTKLRRKRFQRQQTSFDLSEESLDNMFSPEDKTLPFLKELQQKKLSKGSAHTEYKCSGNPFCQLKCTCNHQQSDNINQCQAHLNCAHCCQPTLISPINLRQNPSYKPHPISLPAPININQPPLTTAKPVQHIWRRITLIPSLASARTKSSVVRNEQKAVKVLGVVFVIFVIAWFPFCIMNLLQGVCKRCSINTNILNGFVWLGYVSSSINPVVYTIFNRNFRLKFITLLKCQCLYQRNRQKQLSYYQSYISLHGSRIQHKNYSIQQNDIRRFNAHLEHVDTTLT
ncbi:unnamed protein product [Rotaria magnacalcarata]|uniref:G-protein coupled receptors family 1 profile domain-containing protein n=2 Tax=Rotaria magnacalcarata TaxID=392030 RepID=A0A815ZPU3_9BILA|nr:unnamed protein product [Rotaria magnacalcarata]CAF1585014.1 unnamed protein product [Rotaria magnacalcarata]CAF1925971.1 unnamed protein product [Rotaria magnacalcarata]CAF2122579.1 unnamed protein product [Rotaria magnacalcarata]CAF4147186.1 unnamed protein product [Rotaria magnacalcarata]